MNNVQTVKPEIDQLNIDSEKLKELHGDIKAMRGELESIKTAASNLGARLLRDEAAALDPFVTSQDGGFDAVLRTYEREIGRHKKNPINFNASFQVKETFDTHINSTETLLRVAVPFVRVAKQLAADAQGLQPSEAKNRSIVGLFKKKSGSVNQNAELAAQKFKAAKRQLAKSMKKFETQTQSLSQKVSAYTTQPAPAFNPATQPDESELFAPC